MPMPAGRTGTVDVFRSMEHLDARERDEMHSLLAQSAGRIRDAAGANEIGISEDMVASSDIGSAIVHEAKRANVEAIVMGSRGRSDFASLMLGSTSHKVLHLAPCPVIVVR
jgi:nucleotide-binding universal stress UspA family protein